MEISTYVGSSAGSIITTYLAAGYSLDNIFNSFLGREPQEPIDPADITPKILPRLTYQKMFKIRPGLAKEQLNQLSFFRRIFMNLLDGNWEALLQLKWLKATGIFSTQGLSSTCARKCCFRTSFRITWRIFSSSPRSSTIRAKWFSENTATSRPPTT